MYGDFCKWPTVLLVLISFGKQGLIQSSAERCDIKDFSDKDTYFVTTPPGESLYAYKCGNKFTVTCGKTGQYSPVIRVTTRDGLGTYEAYWNKTTRGNFERAQIYNTMTSPPAYKQEGPRCVEIQINSNVYLNQSKIECCTTNPEDRCVAYRLITSDSPHMPDVHISAILDTKKYFIGEKVTYTCMARPGTNKVVTFAIIQNGSDWARYYWKNGSIVDFRTPPKWLDITEHTQFTIVSGNDTWWGGLYYNVTLHLVISPIHHNTTIGCCTDRLKTRRWLYLEPNKYAAWRDIKITRDVLMAPSVTLAGDSLPGSALVIPMHGCLAIHGTCRGYGGASGTIRFIMDIEGKFLAWDAYTKWEDVPPTWMSLSEMEVKQTEDYGLEVNFFWTMQPIPDVEWSNQTLQCVSEGGDRSFPTYYNTSERFTKANPVLTPLVTDDNDNETEFQLTLTCKSQLGEGKVQSWQVHDIEMETQSEIIVEMGEEVIGLDALPWIEIDRVTENATDLCGTVVINALRLFKNAGKKRRKFTCFSYDIRDRRLVAAFSKGKMSASYIYGEEDQYDLFVWLMIGTSGATAVLCLLLCILCYSKNIGMRRSLRNFPEGEDLSSLQSDTRYLYLSTMEYKMDRMDEAVTLSNSEKSSDGEKSREKATSSGGSDSQPAANLNRSSGSFSGSCVDTGKTKKSVRV